jgi:hypothetical protein
MVMKKLFFFAGMSFLAFFVSIGCMAFAQSIQDLSPLQGKEFSACSCFDPPTFEWTIKDFVPKTLQIHFAADQGFLKPLKVKGKKDVNQLTIKSGTWKKVLRMPGAQGGTVYWKVICVATDKTKVESAFSSFLISGSEAVENPRLFQPTVDSPPSLYWENACNTKFKVWFGTDSAFSKKKSLSVSIADPDAGDGHFQISLSKKFWASLKKMLGPTGSSLYWYVESRDALKRTNKTSPEGVAVHFPAAPLELETYSYKAYLQVGGPLKTIFTIKKPKGWEVIISGMCTTLAFLIYDPNEPLRQIFYFGSVRPVYMSQAQKDNDQYICSLVQPPCPYSWVDAPVVNPLTVENFFSHWPEIASMQNATSFMPEFPKLKDLELISGSAMAQTPMMPGAETTLVRGVFTDGNPVSPKAAQGQFLATVLPDPFIGAGTGSGYIIFGATTPVSEFKDDIDKLVESLNSFTMTDVYFNWCVAQSQQQWGAVAEIGQTLSEASDIIMEGWLSRTAAQDIMAYKYNDSVRSVEKLWDPGGQNVYEFEAGWYDQYKLNPGQYNISTLEPMPDGRVDLWEGTILDGSTFVYQN